MPSPRHMRCGPLTPVMLAAALLAAPVAADAQRTPDAATREWLENCDRGG
jgi:hypothetical protein